MTKQRAMAAKKTWQENAEVWRSKIQTAQIVNRVNQCALGEIDMSPTQLKAAVSLLSKVMPDLSASEVIKKSEQVNPQELIGLLKQTNPELAAMLEQQYAPESSELH